MKIFFGILIAVILFLILMLFLVTALSLHLFFGKRFEENPNLLYKTEKDFPNLLADYVTFPSGKNTLSGAFYQSAKVRSPKGLILFLHGIGAGHHSYTTEINTLAQAGFLVFSYDNTGCVISSGKSIRSFYQAVKDLESALSYLDQTKYASLPTGIAGHSWGAYTACQSLSVKGAEKIRGICAFSPFERADKLLAEEIHQVLPLPAALFSPLISLILFIKDGRPANRKTSDVLAESSTPVLLFHGTADTSVPLSESPAALPSVKNQENISVHLCEGRCHNVYQSARSEQYLNETFAAIQRLEKAAKKEEGAKKQLASLYAGIDYDLITEEDPAVMHTVTDFFDQVFA